MATKKSSSTSKNTPPKVNTKALQDYLDNAEKRKAELDVLSSSVKITPNAGKTPAVGEKVSQAEVDIYMANKPVKASGESNTDYNARVTQWYKDQPHSGLTPEQAAADATLRWVRTGAGGEGEYKVVYPIGVGFNKTTGQPSKASSGVADTGAAVEIINNGDGSVTYIYADGRKSTQFPPGMQAGSSAGGTLISTETDEYGNVIGVYSNGATKILIPSGRKYKLTVDEDAYTILESTMKDFGLEELVPEIKKFMEAGLGSNQAGVELRKTEAYTTRFKGNEIRRSTGLNVLSEAEYLALEDSYSQTLRAYGLQNYFGIDRKVKTAAMSDIIGNDISAVEFKDRIDTVVNRVNNADPTIKKTLNSFYNITDDDLVKYFLNPKENLPKLQEKVTAAEIGSAALGQGLLTDVARATALAQLGVTKEKAMEGYAAIGQVLPTTTKLGQIYGEEGINYTQTTAEEEVFAQLESARRKRMKLAEKEVGSFSGASGLAKGALGRGTNGTF